MTFLSHKDFDMSHWQVTLIIIFFRVSVNEINSALVHHALLCEYHNRSGNIIKNTAIEYVTPTRGAQLTHNVWYKVHVERKM